MARILPEVRIFGASLNPGPFSIKEHVVVTIMAGVGATSAYAVSFLIRLLLGCTMLNIDSSR